MKNKQKYKNIDVGITYALTRISSNDKEINIGKDNAAKTIDSISKYINRD